MMSQTIGYWMRSVKEVFTEEIQAAQGTIINTFEDDALLLVRSVLPRQRIVGPDDPLQAGVALRVSGPNIAVYPYVFRLVCTNGAILAHVLRSQQVFQVDPLLVSEIDGALRMAVRACCQEELFAAVTDQIRAGKDVIADPALTMIPHLARLPHNIAARIINTELLQWMRSADRSRFSLMNAITALARDTADPETKWQLEELGGRIGVPGFSRPPSSLSGEVKIERVELQEVAG